MEQIANGDTTDVDYADLRTFHETGLLQEVNRLILHPAGYALAIAYDRPDGEALGMVLRRTTDEEGFVLERIDTRKARTAARLVKAGVEARIGALGYGVQPIADLPQLIVSLRDQFTETGSTTDGAQVELEEARA